MCIREVSFPWVSQTERLARYSYVRQYSGVSEGVMWRIL